MRLRYRIGYLRWVLKGRPGPVGDGKTDDTFALQRMIDERVARGLNPTFNGSRGTVFRTKHSLRFPR